MVMVFGSGVYLSGLFGSGLDTPAPSPGNAAVVATTGNACELAVDELTGDIALPIRWVRGYDAIAQRIRARLRFFLGEWFLDTRQGMPYFQRILKKHPRMPVVNALFRKAIRTTPGVKSVDSLTVKIAHRNARVGSVDFRATLDDGLILTATDEPFIVRSTGAHTGASS